MNKYRRRYIAGLLLVLVACFTGAAKQAVKETNLSGTWASDDGTTVIITQQGPEIRIREMRVKSGTAAVSELTYFADARGETNPARDGRGELQSVTKWSDGVLIVKFSLPPARNARYPVKSERTDAWGLSRDGKKLTHTRSFTSSPSRLDPSSNPGAAPRGPAILEVPLSWKEKRTFKKVA